VTASASRRDSLLGLAAGGLAAGFLLYTIARLLELTDSFVRPYPTELQAAAAFHVLSGAAAAAAFALAATAFLRAPERRAERLSMATAALATSFLAGAVGHATTTVFLSTQRFTQRGAEGAYAVQAAGAFALAVAAVVRPGRWASRAPFCTRLRDCGRRRSAASASDGRLGVVLDVAAYFSRPLA
jgi:cation transporter-like permease